MNAIGAKVGPTRQCQNKKVVDARDFDSFTNAVYARFKPLVKFRLLFKCGYVYSMWIRIRTIPDYPDPMHYCTFRPKFHAQQ